MTGFFLRIYDYLLCHRRLCFGLMIGITVALIAMMSAMRYNENINDFLPLGGNDQKALTLYQDISGGKRIVVLFHAKDTANADRERLEQAVDTFGIKVLSGGGKEHIHELTTQVDFDKMSSIVGFVYDNLPVMLCDSDYTRMERLLADSAYIGQQLANDVQMMMPATGLFSTNIGNDPLGLFTPVMERLQSRQSSLAYEMDNGYIFTQGGKYAVAMMTTPYGAVESANNAKLADYVDSVARQTMEAIPDVVVEVTGAPIIAVGNAKQIKTDSVLAIAIAVTLILALLVFSFRSWKSLLLIGVSIVFGWVFAMGFMAAVRDGVSIIVLGIGSMIIGIAVNYPLHFIAHTAHGGTVRDVLRDMVSPLLIGNITTVGAFAALVPLDAPALHDLGLFAAFMLIGTIIFALVFLPHLVKSRTVAGEEKLSFGRLAAKSPDHHRWILAVVAVVTIVLGYFSLGTSFDSNMHNINYMSDDQQRLLSDLQTSAGVSDTSSVYLVTEGKTWDEALSKRRSMASAVDRLNKSSKVRSFSDITSFVCSEAEQQRRIDLWNDFWGRHTDMAERLAKQVPHYGFSADAFEGFSSIIKKRYAPHPFDYYEPLTSLLLSSQLSTANGGCSVVDVLHVNRENIDSVKASLNESISGGGYAFDFVGMNSAIANSLSDNFNYIGYACSIIVFVFLWISMGRIELSMLSFLPMALGWVWILGMMELFDMQFNIVNIILATFIFGQGDDYTIFMTDGLVNEYAYRRKLLPSYKNSIVISALIMFIGMGSLIVAKHPALYSLAEVTIVGMFTVVLMAWLVPPLIFGWIVKDGDNYRHIPVTLEQVLRTSYAATVLFFELAYACVLGWLFSWLPGDKVKREQWFHCMICHAMRTNVGSIHGVKTVVRNVRGESFSRGSIIVCDHQSILDLIYLLALSPKVLIAVGRKLWHNPIAHSTVKFARFINVDQPLADFEKDVGRAVASGYSVAIFPEEMRTTDRRMMYSLDDVSHLARTLNADLLPIFIHGVSVVMPKDTGFVSRGQITVEVGQRMTAADLSRYGDNLATNAVRQMYTDHFAAMRRQIEDAHFFHHFVITRYIYKGISVERETKRLLRRYDDFAQWVNDGWHDKGANVVIYNSGKGQFALLYALVHPEALVWAYSFDNDDATLATCCVALPTNLHTMHCGGVTAATAQMTTSGIAAAKSFLLFPDEQMKAATSSQESVIIELS